MLSLEGRKDRRQRCQAAFGLSSGSGCICQKWQFLGGINSPNGGVRGRQIRKVIRKGVNLGANKRKGREEQKCSEVI